MEPCSNRTGVLIRRGRDNRSGHTHKRPGEDTVRRKLAMSQKRALT